MLEHFPSAIRINPKLRLVNKAFQALPLPSYPTWSAHLFTNTPTLPTAPFPVLSLKISGSFTHSRLWKAHLFLCPVSLMNSYLSLQSQLQHLPFSPSICAHLLHHITVVSAQSPFCLLSQLFESGDSAVFIFRCSGSGQNLIQKSEQMSMECTSWKWFSPGAGRGCGQLRGCGRTPPETSPGLPGQGGQWARMLQSIRIADSI